MSRGKPFASWVFFDTEATGLKRRPRITELCMLAVLTDELMSTSRSIPRVINKLQLCFNPESAIMPEASRLTNLYNDVLELMSPFRDQASLVTGFLSSLPQPVCIIAHNGRRFDFTLLQSELHNANQSLPTEAEVYCADSLEAFRVLDGLPAVPEWVVQKKREEEERKVLPCNTAISPAQKKDRQETGSSAVVAARIASDHTQKTDRFSQAESRVFSPAKRCIQSSSDDSASPSKLSKIETVPTFSSQSSITDADLAIAYDAVIAQVEGEEEENEPESPASEQLDISLQAEQETTPVKDPSWTTTGSFPGPIMKKPPPVSVSVPQAAQVVRRLFVEESDSSKVESFHAASNNDFFPKNTLDVSHTLESEMPFTQGTLPDGEMKKVKQTESELVASLASSGAGEPVLMSRDEGALSLRFRHAEDPQSSSLQTEEKSKKTSNTPVKPQTPTETSMDLTPSSRLNQVSEVTSSSSSSSSDAIQTNGKDSLKAAPASDSSLRLSYKLGEVYRRQFGKYPDVAHTAEDDCLTLLSIIVSKRSEFKAFVEDNAMKFDSVEPMY